VLPHNCKVSLRMKHYAVKNFRSAAGRLGAFFLSTLYEGEWSVPRSGHFTPEEIAIGNEACWILESVGGGGDILSPVSNISYL